MSNDAFDPQARWRGGPPEPSRRRGRERLWFYPLVVGAGLAAVGVGGALWYRQIVQRGETAPGVAAAEADAADEPAPVPAIGKTPVDGNTRQAREVVSPSLPEQASPPVQPPPVQPPPDGSADESLASLLAEPSAPAQPADEPGDPAPAVVPSLADSPGRGHGPVRPRTRCAPRRRGGSAASRHETGDPQ